MMSLENDQRKSEILYPEAFLWFLFRNTRERGCIKTHRTESRFVMGPGKCAVCRRVRARFGQEIVQAWAVKGLSNMPLFRYVDILFISQFA